MELTSIETGAAVPLTISMVKAALLWLFAAMLWFFGASLISLKLTERLAVREPRWVAKSLKRSAVFGSASV